jgi:2-polyprenyl-3-methyl-5-hydroxy-6-metoxy-1,4-benzoquinol methylase
MAICQSVHGIDISEKAVAHAQETAKRDGLLLSYEIGDLNLIELPRKAFDLVVAQTSLHHILFLEHVAEQVCGTLTNNGYL